MHTASGKKLPICVIRKRYPGYSRSSVYRHCKKDISSKETDKRKNNKGRRLIRKLYELRKREGSFPAPQLQLETGLTNWSIRTIHRTLKKHGFSCLQTRRKGRMTPSNLKCRVKFANHIKQNFNKDIWKKDKCFYLYGESFVHKLNPRDQARTPKAREWKGKKMKD